MTSRRSQPDTRAWQRMLSGRRLDLLDPSPLDIEIEDIAHGLARVARWNGQTSGAHIFSVAQHTLLVEAVLRQEMPRVDARFRLAALLHDAPEYVIGDMISPFKAVLGGDYKAVERRLLAAIHIRFGLPRVLSAEIERQIKESNDAAASELETHAAERRRALHEVADRLRNRERTLAEQIERELAESVRKVSESFGDVERRLVDQVEKSVAREAARLTEEAAIEFNTAIRTTREEAARRLSRELDRAIESFSRQAERLLGERLAEIGQSGGGQIERRLQNVIGELERRQEEFITQLERRMAQAETRIRQRMESPAGVSGRHPDE